MTKREGRKSDLRPAAPPESAFPSLRDALLHRWDLIHLRGPPEPVPLLRKRFTPVRVGESRSDPGRSLSRSCNLTVHSTFCIRGMFGPAVSESLGCTASNARLGTTSAVEETPSKPPLLNIWMTCCFNLPVSYNHVGPSAS